MSDLLAGKFRDTPSQSEPVRRCFIAATGGADNEIDTIGFIIEAFKDLQGHEIARVLRYVEARYTKP